MILCTGKVYYDLLKARDATKADDAALVRVEQLYPLHTERLQDDASRRTRTSRNGCGARRNRRTWARGVSSRRCWANCCPPRKRFLYAGRNASASPAVGAKTLHDREQKQLVAEAFSL